MKQSILLQLPNTCKTGCIDYLKVNNKLSEFDTPEKKLAAIRNLGINLIDIVQNLGDDPTVVMSQKAVTSSINESNLIKIYESENNLPTSAETGRFAAVVHQIDNLVVTELFFKNPQSWEKVGAVKTITSEELLYEDDPIGTLKIFAYDGIKTAKFKELYQPNKDEIDIDQMIFNTENLSKVTKLYIDEIATISDNIHMVLFIARNHENAADPCIILNTEGYALVVDFGDNNVKHELLLFERTETGILINEIGLNTVNNYLSTDEYCFGGIYDIDNNIIYDNIDVFKVDGFVLRGALYFKEVDGWKNYSDVLKTSEYKIEKNTEQIALVEKELHNSIVKVNYVEDLDPKSPSGTLASVNFTNTTLEEFDGGFYTVTLQFPDEIYIDPNYTTSELYYYPANINVDGTFGGMLSSPHCGLRFYNTGNELTINDISNHNIIVTYEDGVLREVNNEALQLFYHTVNLTTGSWKVRNGYLPKLSEELLQIWQNFIEQPFIFSNPTLFVKKSKGWEQYNKILDNSITRDKIRDYTITEDKLEYPLQLKLDRVSTLVLTTNTLQTNLNTEIQNRTTQYSGLRTSINSINDKLSELKGVGVSIVESVDDLPLDAEVGAIASVLETTVEEKSLDVGHESLSGERVVRVEINNAVYLSISNNFEFILTTKDDSAVEILSKGSGPDTQLYFIGSDGSEMILAEYSRQYNTAELNSTNIEFLNELLLSDKYYSKDNYTNSEQSAISAFFKGITVEKEVTSTKVYVKNTAGWEQYSELVDGSVTAEKLSEGIQESLTKVNTFLDTAALSDEVIDTLKEIQEYIESDASGASAMITDIATNKSNIEELTARLDELNNSVEIVNDLTTGGTDKALSAEMGKTLSERIEEVAEITNSGEEVTVLIVDENVVGLPISKILEFTEIRANSILRNETTVNLTDYAGNKGEIIVVKNYSDTDNVLKDVFMYKMSSAVNGTSSGSYDVYLYTQSLYVTDGTIGEYVFLQYAYDNTYYRNEEDGKIYSFNSSTTIQEVIPKKSVSIQEAIDDIYSKLALLTT